MSTPSTPTSLALVFDLTDSGRENVRRAAQLALMWNWPLEIWIPSKPSFLKEHAYSTFASRDAFEEALIAKLREIVKKVHDEFPAQIHYSWLPDEPKNWKGFFQKKGRPLLIRVHLGDGRMSEYLGKLPIHEFSHTYKIPVLSMHAQVLFEPIRRMGMLIDSQNRHTRAKIPCAQSLSKLWKPELRVIGLDFGYNPTELGHLKALVRQTQGLMDSPDVVVGSEMLSVRSAKKDIPAYLKQSGIDTLVMVSESNGFMPNLFGYPHAHYLLGAFKGNIVFVPSLLSSHRASVSI
jgi:hypothetical protein